MRFALSAILAALVALCAAKEAAARAEAHKIAVIFEKSKVTGTVLTSVYDIEEDGRKFHSAACSNKLAISDLKLDVEFSVDDYGNGALRVSESEFIVEETSDIISGIDCSTTYSMSHVRAECVLPLDLHNRPLGRIHRNPHFPRPHHRVGSQRSDGRPKYDGYVPIRKSKAMESVYRTNDMSSPSNWAAMPSEA